jgi:hypothetical protein
MAGLATSLRHPPPIPCRVSSSSTSRQVSLHPGCVTCAACGSHPSPVADGTCRDRKHDGAAAPLRPRNRLLQAAPLIAYPPSGEIQDHKSFRGIHRRRRGPREVAPKPPWSSQRPPRARRDGKDRSTATGAVASAGTQAIGCPGQSGMPGGASRNPRLAHGLGRAVRPRCPPSRRGAGRRPRGIALGQAGASTQSRGGSDCADRAAFAGSSEVTAGSRAIHCLARGRRAAWGMQRSAACASAFPAA